MFEFINFKDEAVALTKWLISIPSVTTTKGEADIAEAVWRSLKDTSYFKENPDNLIYVPHQDGVHHSICALVKCADENISDTVCLLCHCDTSGNDEYGVLKPYAFKSDELKEKLRTYFKIKSRRQTQLSYDNTVYGLGSFECKAAAGTLITMVKEVSDNLQDLPFNLLFVCTTQCMNGSSGIRECLPYLSSLINDHALDLKLSVTFRPEENQEEDNTLKLYVSNSGLCELGFYILGQEADKHHPFQGFSPAQTAAHIIEKTELSCDFCSLQNETPYVPVLRGLMFPHRLSDGTQEAAIITFDLPFARINFATAIEKMKVIAAQSLEESCLSIENRQSLYQSRRHEEFKPRMRDAEVLSYSDLLYRASRRYRGDLNADMEKLLERCRNEHLSEELTIHAVISKLSKLARLPKPSVVVFLGSNFIPRQYLRQNNADDREIYMTLNRVAESFNNEHVQQILLKEGAPASDCCFMRPAGTDHAGEILNAESPSPAGDFYDFSAPAVTLTYRGQDLNEPTEHVSTEIFDIIPSFLLKVFEEFKSDPKDGQSKIGN